VDASIVGFSDDDDLSLNNNAYYKSYIIMMTDGAVFDDDTDDAVEMILETVSYLILVSFQYKTCDDIKCRR